MDIGWPIKNMKHRYLIAIPLTVTVILALSFLLRGVPLTMDFSGGTHISIRAVDNVPHPFARVEAALKKELGGEVEVHQTLMEGERGLEIEMSLYEVNENEIENILSHKFPGMNGEYSVPKRMGSIITNLYKSQAIDAAIGAAIAIAILLFISLRHFPTVGGILAVIGLDLVGIFGGMSILNIPLGLASMAGILLIFGYGVNTNILLSTRVLRRFGGSPRERAAEAMVTGITMSSTTVAAMLALYLVSAVPALEHLSGVLVIGILVDMMNTWLLNSSLITYHAEQMGERYYGRI